MWASKNRGGHTSCFDDEVERTRSVSGEGTTSATSASIVIEGNRETNGSLGDDGRERDRNTSLPRLDIDATFADTEAGCTIGPTSSKVGRASTLEEAGTRAR
jgi:hypothetical protein